MAQRGPSVGAFIAIGILGLLAAAFIYLFYDANQRVTALESRLKTGKVEDFLEDDVVAGKWRNEQIVKLLTDRNRYEETVEARNDEIETLQARIADTEAEVEEWKTRFNKSEGDLEEKENELNLKVSRIEQLETEIEKLRAGGHPQLEAQIENLQQELEKSQAQVEVLSRKLQRKEEMRQTVVRQLRRRIKLLERQSQGLQQVINNKMDVERGRQLLQGEAYDGAIIAADVKNRFVVVNLGSANRLRRGMRFDVIRWRFNKWEQMGAVEIVKVHPTVSEAVILDRITRKKVCPVTGYIAKDPEEEISPYARSGINRDKVVELVDAGIEEKPGMEPLDPILVGDKITNPFYSRERQLKFVVAGERVQYARPEIEEKIREYGGVIQNEVGVDTDYLVLGKIPEPGMIEQSEEAKKRYERAVTSRDTAQLYGIPILREVELFDFLRQ